MSTWIWNNVREDIIETSKAILPKGSTIYTVLCNSSNNNTIQFIKVLIIDEERSTIQDISSRTAFLLSCRISHNEAMVVLSSSGENMEEDVVNSLGAKLYKDTQAFKHKRL